MLGRGEEWYMVVMGDGGKWYLVVMGDGDGKSKY